MDMMKVFGQFLKEYSFVVELPDTLKLSEFQSINNSFKESFETKPDALKNIIGLEPKQALNLSELIDVLNQYNIPPKNFIICHYSLEKQDSENGDK